ncbi:Elongator subunit elp2 [Vermiconidia calcicola]|uniref:Elongator subunit elp2 n=1 Tax=Vermiconidia calcicola TaxID=1690605 RepID=A0ACC3NRE6_9PEZI|nr:Elongator subunit elp2 [Vermiconidia calcicola]
MATLDFLAAGGNRHPSAADWRPGLMAFGAGNNLALRNPEDELCRGITALLSAHTDTINAVKILDGHTGRRIITGSADRTIHVWKATQEGSTFESIQCLTEHQGSVNVLSGLSDSGLFASGSADGTVNVWSIADSEARLVQSISLKPRYLPLTSALVQLGDGTVLLAVAGTSNRIQLYARSGDAAPFELQATLAGHEGWVRSLDFNMRSSDSETDIILASASQDKYIRLWRLHRSQEPAYGLEPSDLASAPVRKSLSNMAHQVGAAEHKYNVTFEALLIGHEDWVYTVRWAPSQGRLATSTLLSASADNSIAMWRADEKSGVWICETRLGEISAQKGSTTATGSTGGFWIGLWRPDGLGVASLGRTGSWKQWAYHSSSDSWLQQMGISGHTKEVQALAWAPDGSYLLSTGSDQTTRLFAEWKREGSLSWHEFARPQIHGYDLNCIGALTPHQFISGADEKLLRVFNKPRVTDQLLSNLCGTKGSTDGELPDAANIPVLGLSNKAVTVARDDDVANSTVKDGYDHDDASPPMNGTRNAAVQLDHPPFEEHLARHSLWPEHEKLYGHGYEISTAACSNDGMLVATACKASSIDHAVIRLYECQEWREVKPPLTAHSLTVTSLSFSPDDRYLLSVSRDRGWFVFERGQTDSKAYNLYCNNTKGHSRMILDCSWAPKDLGYVFATAGRDKAVRVWRLADGKAECVRTETTNAAVTAVAFSMKLDASNVTLAFGTEEGNVHIVRLDADSLGVLSSAMLDQKTVPSGAVNALRWRPIHHDSSDTIQGQIAVASDDASERRTLQGSTSGAAGKSGWNGLAKQSLTDFSESEASPGFRSFASPTLLCWDSIHYVSQFGLLIITVVEQVLAYQECSVLSYGRAAGAIFTFMALVLTMVSLTSHIRTYSRYKEEYRLARLCGSPECVQKPVILPESSR